MKKIWKWLVGLGLVLLLAIGGFAKVWYDQGQINGTWRSEALAEELMTEILSEIDSSLEELNIDPSKLVKDAVVELSVEDNEATLTGSFRVDKSVFFEAYDKMIEAEYNNLLESIAQEASAVGLDRDTALKQLYGDNYETTIKAMFPTRKDIEAEFDTTLGDMARQEGMTYDSESGTMTGVALRGTVNPWIHLMTNAERTDSRAISDFEVGYYNKSKDQLVFNGDKQYTFTRVN